MKPIAKLYAIVVSVIGIALGAFCLYEYIIQLTMAENIGRELSQLIVLFLLAYICRCLPIYIRPDFAIDMAFIGNVAMLLCKGPIVAAAITLICSPFVVSSSAGPEKKLTHIFNTPLIKTAFNTSNFIISVYLGGRVFLWAGGVIGNLSFPGVALPIVALILAIITVNSFILILLFKLNLGTPFFVSMLRNLIDFLPSVIAAAPIGYFIATF
ncbi:MAG: hypothetical protein RR372_05220, partial [Oscillospiraceae bacterium]